MSPTSHRYQVQQVSASLYLAHAQHRYSQSKAHVSKLASQRPVWAIGAEGKPADPEYVARRHAQIRAILCQLFPKGGEDIPILFGGSVNSGNADSYIRLDNVDGLFVGRAAWTAPTFNSLLRQILPEFQSKF